MSGFTSDERRKQGAMERHLQTGIQFILLGLLAWIGNSVVDLRDGSVEQKTQLVELKGQVTAINSRFADYPTRLEIQSRFDGTASRFQDVDRRLDSIEHRARR